MDFESFCDGFGLMRDAQTAKSQSFETVDGWFAYNLAVNPGADVLEPVPERPNPVIALGLASSQIRLKLRTRHPHGQASGTPSRKAETKSGLPAAGN